MSEVAEEQRSRGTEEQGGVFREGWRRIVLAWRWLRNPNAVGEPITLQPRGVRLLVLLILGNLVVLGLLFTTLYRLTQTPATTEPLLQRIVITATPGPPSTPHSSNNEGPTPTPLGSGGAIAFTLRRNGNADIYALNQADRQLVRLTHDPAEDRDPAWSPDGNHIAFASNRAGNWDIYLLDLASGALIRLTHDPDFDAHPTWSPDGRWLAFESYRRGNLNIYTMSTTGKQVEPLTTNPAPDYAPAWSPDNHALAFTSFRDGNKDIYLLTMDEEQEVINITHSPDVDEDAPAWSPDGAHLGYASGPLGNPSVQVTTLDPDTTMGNQAQTELFGAGGAPAWSPDGESLIYAYERGGYSHLIAASMTDWALFQEVYSVEGLLEDLAWTSTPLSPRIVARARDAEPIAEPPSYVEVAQPTPTEGAPYTFVALPGVEEDGEQAYLSDRVNESFNALRQRIIAEAGWDYLGELGSSLLPITHTPPSGHSRRSWHICGRAVALDQAPYEADEPRVELIREDEGNVTYWRVFLRAAEQDGSMGEPLREALWDLNARDEDGPASVEGGAPRDRIPRGYYVDFTTLAGDYGWERVSSLWRWRYFWPDIRWWEFQKTSGLNWWDCMLEVFEPDEIEPTFGPIPGYEE